MKVSAALRAIVEAWGVRWTDVVWVPEEGLPDSVDLSYLPASIRQEIIEQGGFWRESFCDWNSDVGRWLLLCAPFFQYAKFFGRATASQREVGVSIYDSASLVCKVTDDEAFYAIRGLPEMADLTFFRGVLQPGVFSRLTRRFRRILSRR